MAPRGQAGVSGGSSGAGTPEGLRSWVRGAYRFATDRSDFRSNCRTRLANCSDWIVEPVCCNPVIFKWIVKLYLQDHKNLIVNLGLFAVGVWVARNLTDIDLMAPQPIA
uniref:Uncharacterized protein n=1 Tax=Sphaerodactylus townsendi TaxID=933632 RepID=A0ACB8F505_9SAUR